MSTAQQPQQSATARGREHTRERLIDAAFEVFAETGLSAASVEQITERAGFTRGAFYSNFDSKVELFFAIADARNARVVATLRAEADAILAEALPAGHPITADAVEGLVTRLLALTAADPTWTLFESEFAALALRDPETGRRFAAHRRAVVGELAELLEGSLGRTGVRFGVPAEQATRLLIGAYSSAMTAQLLSGAARELPAEALADVTALVLLLTERVTAS
jgi:AcrR family transcriptional regulator